MKSKHTIKDPLILTFSGEYKVNKPNDNSGEYVSKEFAEELLDANKELLEIVIEYDKHLNGLNAQGNLTPTGIEFHEKIKSLIQKHTNNQKP